MIEYNFFKDKKTKCNNELRDIFSKYPGIFDFCTNTQGFFERHSQNNLIREKCFIEVLTPEHLKASYEFEIILRPIERNIYYLFTPYKRLDCLDIKESDTQISICPEYKVKNIVRNILSQEIQKCATDLQRKEDDVINEIWESKHGYPCLVYLSNKKYNVKFFKISFYMVAEQKDGSSFVKTIICPIQKHSIPFQRPPFFYSNGSKWLYVSLPEYMEGSLYGHKKNEPSYEIGKSSVRIKSLHLGKEFQVDKLDMKISNPLCFWFYTVYITMICLLFIMLLPICNIVLTKYLNLVLVCSYGVEEYLRMDLISDFFIVILTSVIATRSFLLTENNMLRKYAKNLSILSAILGCIYFFMYMLYQTL